MRRGISKHVRARYPVLLHQLKEEGRTFYVAEFPDLPGCMSHGKSANEALKNAEGAMKLWIRSRLEDGQPIPQPTEVVEFSGKFVLRTPKALHRQLVQQAAQNGVSLNQYAVARLGEATAVDQIRNELQRGLSQVKGEIEALRMSLSNLLVRRVFAYEEMSLGQGEHSLEVLDHRTTEINASPLKSETAVASTAITPVTVPQIRRQYA